MLYDETYETLYDELSDNERKRATTSNDAGTIFRINKVIQYILEGYRLYEIKELVTKQYGVSYREVDRYLARAKKFIIADFASTREEALAEALAMRQNLYKEALESGDKRLALEVLKDIAKLRGLYNTLEPSEQKSDHKIEVYYIDG